MAEALKLTRYDKNTFKAFLKTSIKDPEWAPIFDKNVDLCMDIVPKYASAYGKKIKCESCDQKTALTFNCLLVAGVMECPAKDFRDSVECKKFQGSLKECSQNIQDILKFLESPI